MFSVAVEEHVWDGSLNHQPAYHVVLCRWCRFLDQVLKFWRDPTAGGHFTGWSAAGPNDPYRKGHVPNYVCGMLAFPWVSPT